MTSRVLLRTSHQNHSLHLGSHCLKQVLFSDFVGPSFSQDAMYFQGTSTDQCNWWVNKYYTYQTSNYFGLMSMHVHTCAYMSYCMFQISHLDQLAISQRTVRWWPFGQNDFAAKTSHLRGSPCQVKVRAYPASWCKRVRHHVTPSQVASVAASVASVRQFGPPASLCLGQRPPVNQTVSECKQINSPGVARQ